VLDEIYFDRICRQNPDGSSEFYSIFKLGAITTDLAAISWFFERPYDLVVSTLPETDQSSLLGTAAFGLRAQGRFAEALQAYRPALRIAEKRKLWEVASNAASNIALSPLGIGQIRDAISTTTEGVKFADRSGDEFRMMVNRGYQAYAHFLAGNYSKADAIFRDAERRHNKMRPDLPLLRSIGAYFYCTLFLARGDWDAAGYRAQTAIKTSVTPLEAGLLSLVLSSSNIGLALATSNQKYRPPLAAEQTRAAHLFISRSFDNLRTASAADNLPSAFLVRALFRRNVGYWNGAAADLDEVEEIAELGPMRLDLCDMALEHTRLAFAQIEAYAPLNGMLEKDNPPKPTIPGVGEIAELKKKAEKQLDIAADYIKKCGYHRRDEELAELQAVLRGEKKFADLPPRV
jgi:hypothetical protein